MAEIDFNEADLRRIDLNLLLVFSAVMRAGGVRAAAARLYLGPSGVSMALARLRALVGADLFIRGKSGLEPTPVARGLFAKVAPALSEISAAIHDAPDFDPAVSRRTIRIAMSDDIELVLGARLCRRVLAAAPGMALVFRSGDYRRALDLLDADDADLVVTARPVRLESRHRAQTLYEETFVLLADGQRLGLGASVSIDAFLALPHALVSASGAARGRIDEALDDLGAARRIAVVVERFSTLPFLLKSATVIANVPSLPARVLAAAFGLTCHELPFESPRFEVAALWHARLDHDPAHVWFRRIVGEEIAALTASGPLAAGPVDRPGGARRR